MTPDNSPEQKPLQLWIINHYASSSFENGGGLRHQLLASNLSELGWSTTIIAASTSHSTRRQRLPSIIASNLVNGASWHWIRCPDYASHGALRLWNMLTFTLRILIPKSTSSLPPPDLVIGSTVHPLAAWSALRLARRHNVPFVFEVRDLWPETLIEMGAIRRKGVIARLMRLLEGHLYRNASLIITTMPSADEYIVAFGIARKRISWISNGAEVGAFRVTPPPMNEVFEFLYCGAHGSANDLGSILQGFNSANKTLGDGSIRLKLVGDGPLKESLIKESIELGLEGTVEFVSPVPKSSIPAIIEASDAVVLSVPPLRLYRFGISPNKLFDYLAGARPILLAGNPSNNPVREAKAGVCRATNSVADISSAMIELQQSSFSQRSEWGENGHEHVAATYSYERLAGKLDVELRTIMPDEHKAG